RPDCAENRADHEDQQAAADSSHLFRIPPWKTTKIRGKSLACPAQALRPWRSSRARISTAERVPPVSFSFQTVSVSKRRSPIASDQGRSAASSSPADQTSPPRLRTMAMTYGTIRMNARSEVELLIEYFLPANAVGKARAAALK